MKRLVLAIACVIAFSGVAQAHHRHHHHVVYAHSFGEGLGYGLAHMLHSIGPRPSAWCGWEMRRELGVYDPQYNLARNWAHWGRAAMGPAIGVVVVWAHHVGRIVGLEQGRWVVHSGNDGHMVRDRPRSLAGAIAFRWPPGGWSS
jgi:hypothetical protein